MPYQERLRPPHTFDRLTIGVWNGSWFLAAWGTTTLLAAVLAQAWNGNQSAASTACVASAWLVGGLLGLHLCHSLRRSTFPAAALGAAAYLACALLWWVGIASWFPLRYTGNAASLWRETLLIGTVAFFMGGAGACWLKLPRFGFEIGERVSLAREMICLPLGIFIAWILPREADALGTLFLVPLSILDLINAARRRKGELDCSVRVQGPAAWPPLQLNLRGCSHWWWISYLARRRCIPPIVLAAVLGILTGGIWFSAPTPFIGTLVRTHQLHTLYWLISGTLAAIPVGLFVLSKSRGVVGAPGRLIPLEQQRRAWVLARLSLFAMAASIVALGLPPFQEPWWLALWFCLYTFAEGVWSVLLARLVPDIGAQAHALRHLLLRSGQGLGSAQVQYERAIEDRARLILSTWEGVLSAAAAPLCGMLIDSSSVDAAFVLVGFTLLLLFALAPLVLLLVQEGPQGSPHPVASGRSPLAALAWRAPVEGRA